MNVQISRLAETAKKESRIIIGLMSGTSLDGLDIAVTRITGAGKETTVELLKFKTLSYSAAFKAKIKAIFSKVNVDLQQVCLMNEVVASTHAAMINESLAEWSMAPGDIDAIASHGQTIFHAPASLHKLPDLPNGTLQIGDGDHLAVHTGIITLSDF